MVKSRPLEGATVKRLVSSLLLAVMLVAIPSGIAFAYLYRAPVAISENASTSYDMLAVLWDQNNTWLANNGYMNSSANDTRVQTLAGLNKPWMVADNKTLTAVPVPADSQTNLFFATGESEATAMDIIVGNGGKITVLDDPSLEVGGNFTAIWNGFIDTTQVGANLTSKVDATRTYISATGNITAQVISATFFDDFSTDDWTDVGTGITVNTATSRLDYDALRGNGDDRAYYDLTSTSNTNWRMDYIWNPTSSPVENGNIFAFGLWSAATNYDGYAGDSIFGVQQDPSTIKLGRHDGGVTAFSGTITIVHGTTYYVTLARNTDVLATLNVYTDANRTVHLTGSPVTLAVPATVTTLRYIQASNFAGAGLNGQEIGWIDDLAFINSSNSSPLVAVTAGGITSGEYTVEVGIERR